MEQEDQKIRRFEGDGSSAVIAALIQVHRALGPGLLESAYEACVCRELELRGFAFERRVPLPVKYRGRAVDCAYRIDVVVERSLLLELKSVEELTSVHAAQVLTYMRLANLPRGLLVNFNVPTLRRGLRRYSLPPKPLPPKPF